ncbi:hypothetical protein MHBO_003916 [Bonamia ostreae]|uniref:Uncharacterized protein n=1 Tax=Bonamia ostreae TaxID=126728 RepID=A0ABV2ASN2_9EUKA
MRESFQASTPVNPSGKTAPDRDSVVTTRISTEVCQSTMVDNPQNCEEMPKPI